MLFLGEDSPGLSGKIVSLSKLQLSFPSKLEGSVWAGDALPSRQRGGKQWFKVEGNAFSCQEPITVLWDLWLWMWLLPAEAPRRIVKARERCKTALLG